MRIGCRLPKFDPSVRGIFAAGVLVVTSLAVPGVAASASQSPSGEADEVAIEDVKLTELSTQMSDTYLLPDGSYEMRSYLEPVNYEAGDGDWEPIDSTLVDAPGSTYAVQNAENSFDVLIPADASASPVKLAVDGQWVTARMHGLDDAPSIDDATATFDDVDGADSVTYEATSLGVKEDIHLDAPPGADESLSYVYTLKASSGLTPSLKADGSIAFADPAGNVQVLMPAGTMVDSAAPAAESGDVSYDLADGGDGWKLTVTPDMSWLLDPERIYPVTIDPTLTNGVATKNCWISTSNPTGSNCGSTVAYIRVGKPTSANTRRGLIDFDVSSIPSTATVSDATLSMYLDAAQSVNLNQSTTFSFHRPGNTWVAGATWESNGQGSNWTGGSPVAMAHGTQAIPGTTTGWRWLTGLGSIVQAWVNGSVPKAGLLMKQSSETTVSELAFAALSTTLGAAYRPFITVNYTAPNQAPTTPALAVTPCLDTCTPSWSFTDTLTPSLQGTSTDPDGGSLTYTWEIRQLDSGASVANHTSVVPSGSAASWTVPSGLLANETVYEFRVSSSDGVATSASAWRPLGVDIDELPAAPVAGSLSPCLADCAPLISTSLVPILTAEVDDPDTSLLTADFEVRSTGTTSVIASGTSAIVGSGGQASFQVPAGSLANDGAYQFRAGSRDGSHLTWGSWTDFTVSIPGGPLEPTNLALTSCTADCADWVAATAAPTFSATRPSNDGTGTADFRFEVRSDTGVEAGTISTVAPGATATWTVPAGALGPNAYEVRVGAVSPTGTTWSAWRLFQVTPDADSAGFPQIDASEGGAGYDPAWSPTPLDDVEDSTVSDYDANDLDALDSLIALDEAAAAQAGADANAENSGVPRKVSIPMKYAPTMWLHPDEAHWPLSAVTFANHSDLRWSHEDCKDESLDGSPSQTGMGNGDYTAQRRGTFCLGHEGTTWKSTDLVRPRQDGGPSGHEGMFLDLDDDMRDGDGFNGDEPVYYRYRPNNYLEYWFSWGDSYSKSAGVTIPLTHHEGDWEHIAIKLNDRNIPTRVQYFYHYSSCTLPFNNAPKQSTHVKLWVARDSHGNYPANAIPEPIYTRRDPISGQGPIWFGTNNLQELTSRDWYGYGGGFGQVGNLNSTTGPWGPNPHREASDAPSFATRSCELES